MPHCYRRRSADSRLLIDRRSADYPPRSLLIGRAALLGPPTATVLTSDNVVTDSARRPPVKTAHRCVFNAARERLSGHRSALRLGLMNEMCKRLIGSHRRKRRLIIEVQVGAPAERCEAGGRTRLRVDRTEPNSVLEHQPFVPVYHTNNKKTKVFH